MNLSTGKYNEICHVYIDIVKLINENLMTILIFKDNKNHIELRYFLINIYLETVIIINNHKSS